MHTGLWGVGPRPIGFLIVGPSVRASPECIPRRSPDGPPNSNLVGFTSKFASVFTNITSKFTDILGLDCM